MNGHKRTERNSEVWVRATAKQGWVAKREGERERRSANFLSLWTGPQKFITSLLKDEMPLLMELPEINSGFCLVCLCPKTYLPPQTKQNLKGSPQHRFLFLIKGSNITVWIRNVLAKGSCAEVWFPTTVWLNHEDSDLISLPCFPDALLNHARSYLRSVVKEPVDHRLTPPKAQTKINPLFRLICIDVLLP